MKCAFIAAPRSIDTLFEWKWFGEKNYHISSSTSRTINLKKGVQNNFFFFIYKSIGSYSQVNNILRI